MIKSPLRIEFTDRFNNQRKAAPLKIKVAFMETLELFLENPNHPQLRNHALKERYSGYNSTDKESPFQQFLTKRRIADKITKVNMNTRRIAISIVIIASRKGGIFV